MSPKRRRTTIGENPLDALLPPPAEDRDVSEAKGSGSPPAHLPGASPSPLPPPRPEKVRATFHLPADLIEEARDTVVALSGPPHRLTLAAVAEEAFRRELERLRKAHNDGKRFPMRAGELKGGRPIGS